MKDQLKRVVVLGSGTSTGVPSIGCDCDVCQSSNPKDKRFRSSVLLQTKNEKNILIDCGPDFRMQMLAQGIGKIDAVVFTHTHADHCHGFDDLRQVIFRHKKPIPCYIDKDHASDLKNRFSYAFQDTGYLGTTPKVDFHFLEESDKIFDLDVEVFRLPHGAGTTLGFRFNDFLYFTDFKSVEASIMKKIKGKVQVAVLSAARKILHHSHSSMGESIDLIKKMGAERGVLTHLSHDYDHEKDSQSLPEGIELAYDGMKLDFH